MITPASTAVSNLVIFCGVVKTGAGLPERDSEPAGQDTTHSPPPRLVVPYRSRANGEEWSRTDRLGALQRENRRLEPCGATFASRRWPRLVHFAAPPARR